MEEYNRHISKRVLNNVDGMIDNMPQPTMFGGKRVRKYVLAGSTDYDYPSTLGVGNLTSEMKPTTMGGSFWGDLGNIGKQALNEVVVPVATEVGKDALRSYLKGSAMPMAGANGHGIWHPEARSMVGANGHGIYNPVSHGMEGGNWADDLGKVSSAIAPFAPLLMGLGREAPYPVQTKRGRGRPKKGGFSFSDITSGAKSLGKSVLPVASKVGQEVFNDVLLPAGKDALKDYLKSNKSSGSGRNIGRPKGGNWADDLGKVSSAIAPFAPLLMGLGRPHGGDMASDALNMFKKINPADLSRLIPQDLINRIPAPLTTAFKSYMKGSARPAHVKKLMGAGWLDDVGKVSSAIAPFAPLLLGLGRSKKSSKMEGGNWADDLGKVSSAIAPFAPLLMGLGRGGAMLGNSQYAQHQGSHQSVYPPALASYQGKMSGGRKQLPHSGKKRESARGAIVAEVMRKQGLNLAQASKYVKDHNLY